MKKFILKTLIIAAALGAALSSCTKENEDIIKLFDFTVSLTYPDGISPSEGVTVSLRQTGGEGIFESLTNASGIATFKIPAGVYEASCSYTQTSGEYFYICNGIKSQVVVDANTLAKAVITMSVSTIDNSKALIIKEIYNGGVMKDDNSANFQFDKCIVLYNNGTSTLNLDNIAIGMAPQYNAEAGSNSTLYDNGGALVYENEGFIPGINGIWYFQGTLSIKPFEQVVVNVCGAIDNTQTVTNSVNYANPDYYCMYDPEYEGAGTNNSNKYYNNTSYYPTPAAVIPTSHYLKTVKVGQGNAWPFSATSPAVFIYQTDGSTPKAHAEDTGNLWYAGTNASVSACVKVPSEWILDGVEVWNSDKISTSYKRLTAAIDAGHVNLTNKYGHTLYRNVDKELTEALPENQGLLVYGYSLGYDGSTDPSGIDAEASLKNGAHIVYKDTNNSTNDFHERTKCSLRGE